MSTTVQDEGRHGYREWGVPAAGSFDRRSAGIANALLGNRADAAVLEMTVLGGEYEAQARMALALAGAPFATTLVAPDGTARSLVAPTSFSIAPGDRLRVGTSTEGARAYLAVRGGWQSALILGSRSSETRVKAGDVLAASPGVSPTRHPAEVVWVSPTRDPLRVVDAPDHRQEIGPACLVGPAWRVGAQSNRMGIRLEGPSVPRVASSDRISAPIAPGAVQLAGDQLIVLGIACGTMGGYPHIAHVISADLDRLGQFRPGDGIRFQRVTLAEARQTDRTDRAAHDAFCRRVAAMAADSGLSWDRD